MIRSFLTPTRLLPVIIVMTLVIVLLPERWLGWTKLPGEVLRIALGPFGHAANVSAERADRGAARRGIR